MLSSADAGATLTRTAASDKHRKETSVSPGLQESLGADGIRTMAKNAIGCNGDARACTAISYVVYSATQFHFAFCFNGKLQSIMSVVSYPKLI